MSKQIRNMEQLKDSRLMFEKKLPIFGYMIVLIILIFTIATIIWSVFAVKPYMIKTTCTVTDSDSNYVMSPYTGEIIKSYLKEGDVVHKGDVLFKVKSTDYDLQLEQLEQTKETYQKQIEQYKLLVKSIKDDVNYFDASNEEDELYYSTYEAYQSQVAQNKMDASTYKAYGYTEEQIEAELVKNEGKISEIYYSAIQSAENSVKEAKTQMESIDAQISALGNGKSEYSIKATASGTLHLTSDYKEGMVVQAASAVASITPENADTVMEGYISTADMERIEEGNSVQIAVDGLSQSIYGNIRGKVSKIDSNVSAIENGDGSSSSVFKIKIIPEVDYVISKSGKKVKLSNGMSCETRVQYDEITYFNYVMEKLGLLAR